MDLPFHVNVGKFTMHKDKKKREECSNKKVSAESLRFVCDMFNATLIAFPRSSLFLEEMGFLVE